MTGLEAGLALVLFLPGIALSASSGADVKARVSRDLAAGRPLVVHVVVALCDNDNQGIVPVPKAIGNGQDPVRNLYWGAGYGLDTYFTRHGGWTVERREANPAPGILVRLVLSKTLRAEGREGRDIVVHLVADAWDGREIRKATERFLAMAAGRAAESVPAGKNGQALPAGGAAALVAYVGHDGLMDFSVPPPPAPLADAPPRSAIVLACASKAYFGPHLERAGAHPLVLTTGLMAPEAYTLEAAVSSWAAGDASDLTRRAAAAAYHRYQKCGARAAARLFTGEP
ncbi:MAG: hypothetical protein JNK60_15125 [Acidobacteria bacterium]|nr:hypothetical protein [Acidobacteriota bacterium]